MPRDEVLAALAVLQAAGRAKTYVVVHPPGSALAGFAKALARELPEAPVKAIAVHGDPIGPIVAELTTTDATVDVSTSAARGRWSCWSRRRRRGQSARRRGRARRAAPSGLGLQDSPSSWRGATGPRWPCSAGETGTRRSPRSAPPAAMRCSSAPTSPTRRRSRPRLAEARRLGPIDVVVHAAGVLADGPAAQKDLNAAARVVDTKAGGAEALLAATAADPLRAFLVLTSWAGRFGNAAQTDYSAANHWVAAQAHAWGVRRGARVVALDLPPWEGTDMVATIPEPVRAVMRAAGVTFLDDATGLALVLNAARQRRSVGRGAPRPRRPAGGTHRLRATFRLTPATLPLLDDHRVNGHPVLPLVGAANLALEAAQRALGAPARRHQARPRHRVVVDSETTVWVQAEKTRGAVAIEIHAQAAGGKRGLAYRAEAERAAGALPELVAPRAGERPTLSVADFYAEHTFHGPRLQGVISVDADLRRARRGLGPRLRQP